MGYDSWKAREPDTTEPREHEWMYDEESDQDYCARCGRLCTERNVPLWCEAA